MAYSTIVAVRRGGWLLALVPVFVVIGLGAVFTAVITAVALRMAVTGQAPGSAE